MRPQDLESLVSRNKLIFEFRLGVEYLADRHFAWLLLFTLIQGRNPLSLWNFLFVVWFLSYRVNKVWNNWV